ncbi:nucleoside 2-deoxyribosyltransferase [Oceanobacter mangrovi]|uniref:nucleoside 2-deoxyribosyltransferase n=1 Tax=Oceanobacter mangrovi TaxID=2862510 RepID=UPI001C8E168A|nr:nucleoside 2-deoxyribosyltransferase [Oceanobacter mangrovi]
MKIYLAGPEVFLPNAVEMGAAKKALCAHYGFEGLYPLDSELDAGQLDDGAEDPRQLAFAISYGNEGLIQQADVIIANLTPFRGVSADVGTVYELGLARGLGKQLLAYSNDPRPFADRTMALYGAAESLFGRDEQQPLRDHDGLSVEDFGLHDNLMIEGGIRLAAGRFMIRNVADGERYTDLTAFEELLRWLADAPR